MTPCQSWFARRGDSVSGVTEVARELARGRYMAFTTFRANGDPVVTPVWLADLGDGTVGFTTGAKSGKVRRLARNSRVQAAPCSMRGVVHSGSPLWTGFAEVVHGADYRRVRKAISRRYHVQLAALDMWHWLTRKHLDEVGIVVRFPDEGQPVPPHGKTQPR